jgi:hypothetical protein
MLLSAGLYDLGKGFGFGVGNLGLGLGSHASKTHRPSRERAGDQPHGLAACRRIKGAWGEADMGFYWSIASSHLTSERTGSPTKSGMRPIFTDR